MTDDIERRLFEESAILQRLDALAAEISKRYHGRELTILAILNGSLIFAADLMRRINLPLKLVCIQASSYHGGTASSGTVHIDKLPAADLTGRHVLIVDDILDTGQTLGALRRQLAETKPLSVEICVLLKKAKQRVEAVEASYAGFEIGDEFVVGYGLDFDGRYRNLPFIGTLRSEAISPAVK